ncbi:MAG: hypothetical protein A2Y38_04630 [Spirochaetes bacterium GWB1_59_5]|nr:MAG: hypothetical protein A2Y38_04630 [Spirochaetes bacterium GWB1_59_5]
MGVELDYQRYSASCAGRGVGEVMDTIRVVYDTESATDEDHDHYLLLSLLKAAREWDAKDVVLNVAGDRLRSAIDACSGIEVK